MQATPSSTACPCGLGQYENCCGRIHGDATAQSAEQLMRARYSAYVLGKTSFLHQTWHASTRPPLSDLEQESGTKWLGLDLRKHVPMGDEASVEFVARYKIGGRAHRLHEVSRFLREEGRWFYLDGDFPGR